MGRLSGWSLIGVGIVHNVVGVLAYWGPLADIVRGGVFNAVVSHFDRDAAFWFLVSRVLIFMLGQLVWWSQRRIDTLPAFLGWETLVVAAILAVLMPISGWPLVAVCGGLVLIASRDDGARSALSAKSSGSQGVRDLGG